MNTKKKGLLLALCAVLLVVASVLGTMAYLTSTDTVQNTFTVGNVKIQLDEARVNTDGTPIEGADRVKANEYHLLPGHTYTKDPTVTVDAGSEECYVRMLVTFNISDKLDEVFPNADLASLFLEYDNTKWLYVGNTEDTVNNTRTYEFRYKDRVAQNKAADTELPALFTAIEMPETLSNEDLTALTGLKIEVVANAIQADGFSSAYAAWAAFSA